MAVFCGNCAKSNNWDKPSIRTTEDPCDFCGGHESYRTRRPHPRTGEEIIRMVPLKNFEKEDSLLPGTQAESRIQRGADDTAPTATTGKN